MTAITVLGFDFGTKRIGVAVGQSVTHTGRPLTVVRNTHGTIDWQHIGQLCSSWHPDVLLVGMPYHMDGTQSDMSHQAQAFARRLKQHTQLRVEMIDERLTSYVTRQTLEQRRPRTQKKRQQQRAAIDAGAAAVIVTDWLQQQSAVSKRV